MTELTGKEAAARVKELVEDIDVAMLTTLDESGHLVSRPMSTREMDEDGALWFFTEEHTSKVDQATADHDVGLSYCDTKGMRFVSVAGTASIVHDRVRMEQLYSPALDAWFDKGLRTPGIALLKVTPTVSEFWAPAHGRIVMAVGMLKARIAKDRPDDETILHGRVVC